MACAVKLKIAHLHIPADSLHSMRDLLTLCTAHRKENQRYFNYPLRLEYYI